MSEYYSVLTDLSKLDMAKVYNVHIHTFFATENETIFTKFMYFFKQILTIHFIMCNVSLCSLCPDKVYFLQSTLAMTNFQDQR